MEIVRNYDSPIGTLLLRATESGLASISFADGPAAPSALDPADCSLDRIISDTEKWLDVYFSGSVPDFTPQLAVRTTVFRAEIYDILLRIPYGQTRTYGEIAAGMAAVRGIPRMSARAVGSAVGHNPVPIIIPCHRVIGADGGLTGYSGGLEKKEFLLRLEKII